MGAQVPVGTGLAFASKYSTPAGEDTPVAVAMYGDGAANQGQIWESSNMASLWKVSGRLWWMVLGPRLPSSPSLNIFVVTVVAILHLVVNIFRVLSHGKAWPSSMSWTGVKKARTSYMSSNYSGVTSGRSSSLLFLVTLCCLKMASYFVSAVRDPVPSQLPMIFCIENNQYGMGTSKERSSSNSTYFTMGNHIPGIKLDGMNVLMVREVSG